MSDADKNPTPDTDDAVARASRAFLANFTVRDPVPGDDSAASVEQPAASEGAVGTETSAPEDEPPPTRAERRELRMLKRQAAELKQKLEGLEGAGVEELLRRKGMTLEQALDEAISGRKEPDEITKLRRELDEQKARAHAADLESKKAKVLQTIKSSIDNDKHFWLASQPEAEQHVLGYIDERHAAGLDVSLEEALATAEAYFAAEAERYQKRAASRKRTTTQRPVRQIGNPAPAGETEQDRVNRATRAFRRAMTRPE